MPCKIFVLRVEDLQRLNSEKGFVSQIDGVLVVQEKPGVLPVHVTGFEVGPGAAWLGLRVLHASNNKTKRQKLIPDYYCVMLKREEGGHLYDEDMNVCSLLLVEGNRMMRVAKESVQNLLNLPCCSWLPDDKEVEVENVTQMFSAYDLLREESNTSSFDFQEALNYSMERNTASNGEIYRPEIRGEVDLVKIPRWLRKLASFLRMSQPVSEKDLDVSEVSVCARVLQVRIFQIQKLREFGISAHIEADSRQSGRIVSLGHIHRESKF